jgi:hypothetical protein
MYCNTIMGYGQDKTNLFNPIIVWLGNIK